MAEITKVKSTLLLPTYDQAVTLRMKAEECTDPKRYDIAAAAFTAIGMLVSASACAMRAEHYRNARQEETP